MKIRACPPPRQLRRPNGKPQPRKKLGSQCTEAISSETRRRAFLQIYDNFVRIKKAAPCQTRAQFETTRGRKVPPASGRQNNRPRNNVRNGSDCCIAATTEVAGRRGRKLPISSVPGDAFPIRPSRSVLLFGLSRSSPSRPCTIAVHGAQRRSGTAAWPPEGFILDCSEHRATSCKVGLGWPVCKLVEDRREGSSSEWVEPTKSARPSICEAEPGRASATRQS